MTWDDESQSWDEDPEGPSDEDRRRFSAKTICCPECGDEVYDESVSCPSCGHWSEGDDRGGSRRRWGPAAIGLGMALLLALGGLVSWLVRFLA
jgi:hydrogenase maturation factor HypF (carbamoyltransferase family)